MTKLNNFIILFFPNLFGRLLFANLNSFREYTQFTSSSDLTFLSAEKQLSHPRKKVLQLEKESFSQKDISTFTRYERFCYLRELVNFVARYRTNAARFVQNNWEDQLIVSAGNDPISDVFNVDTIPMSHREIFPEQFKEISHDLNTGRLLFGSPLTSSCFEDSFVSSPLSSDMDNSHLVGGNYQKYKKSINILIYF